MIQYHMIAYGRVQNVGFRFFVQQQAIQHNLTGWIKNLADGRVEFEIQGAENNLQAFEYLLAKGSRFIRIDHLERRVLATIKAEREFRITD